MVKRSFFQKMLIIVLTTIPLFVDLTFAQGFLPGPLPFSGEVILQPICVHQGSTPSDSYKEDVLNFYQDQLAYAVQIFSQIGLTVWSQPMLTKAEIQIPGEPEGFVNEKEFIAMLQAFSPDIPSGTIGVLIVKHWGNPNARTTYRGQTKPPATGHPGIILNLRTGVSLWTDYASDALAHEMGHFLLNGIHFVHTLDGGIHLAPIDQKGDRLMYLGSNRTVVNYIGDLSNVSPLGNLAQIDYSLMINEMHQVEAMYQCPGYIHNKMASWSTHFALMMAPWAMSDLPISAGIIMEGNESEGLILNWGGPALEANIVERISDFEIDYGTGQIKVIHHDTPKIGVKVTAWGRLVGSAVDASSPMMAEYCVDAIFSKPFDYNPFIGVELIEGFGGQMAYCALIVVPPSLVPALSPDIQVLGYQGGKLIPVQFTLEENVIIVIPISEMLGLERLRLLYMKPPVSILSGEGLE